MRNSAELAALTLVLLVTQGAHRGITHLNILLGVCSVRRLLGLFTVLIFVILKDIFITFSA